MLVVAGSLLMTVGRASSWRTRAGTGGTANGAQPATRGLRRLGAISVLTDGRAGETPERTIKNTGKNNKQKLTGQRRADQKLTGQPPRTPNYVTPPG